MTASTLMTRFLLGLGACAWAACANAQLLANVSVAPAQAKPGEAVKATVNFDVTGGINCGLHLHWGDGKTDTFKINQTKDVPLVASHTYEKPGNYTIRAEGKGVGAVFKCGGKTQQAAVAVVAPPPIAPVVPVIPVVPAPGAGATAAKKVLSPCPAGWTLSKAGVNSKTKAFTCTANANTAVPDPKISCPGDLTYFENAKKGQLGCRP